MVTATEKKGTNWRQAGRYSPEIVLFLSALADHIAGSSCYFFIYRYYSERLHFPFEYKNRRQTCPKTLNKTQSKTQSQVQADVSHYQIIDIYCSLIPSLLAAVILGPLSDKIGRTPIMKFGLIGQTIKHMIHYITIKYELRIEWFFVATFMGGFGGGVGGIRMAATAYVVDVCTSPSELAFKLALLQGIELTATMLSAFSGGPFVQMFGFMVPVMTGLVLQLLAFLHLQFVLKEPTYHQVREDAETTPTGGGLDCKHLLTQPTELVKILHKKRDTKRELYVILIASILITETNHMFAVGEQLILISTPFCMPPNLLSYFHGIRNVLHIGGILFGTKVALKYASGLFVCLFSLFITAFDRMTMIFINTTSMVFIASILGFFHGWYGPITRAYLSTSVTKKELGSIFSLLSISTTIISSFTKSVFLGLYANLHKHGHVRWFFVITAPLGIFSAPFICLYWRCRKQREEQDEKTITGEMPTETKSGILNSK